ncbi:putative hydro-lyase [Cysteiniphilum halobium]|uniref:putative hydro-lyase n=1 Tax=Cysteiniphilum halobium TaxID=2219059 RepID=UPI003F827ABF
MTPKQLRSLIRDNKFTQPTTGLCDGYVQTNLVIIERKHANDFKHFCQRNPTSCPLVFSSKVGQYMLPQEIASSSDIRTDLTRYRIYKKGKLQQQEELDISNLWQDDFVIFLIGCSFTFESALIAHGLSISHIKQRKNVPMYATNIPCQSAGRFKGNTVVSMRLFKQHQIDCVVEISGHYPKMHGAPIHVGDPAEIGIVDIDKPDFGDCIMIEEDDIPVFWGCGVTPQLALMDAKLDIAITHSPGYMFVTDLLSSDYYECTYH